MSTPKQKPAPGDHLPFGPRPGGPMGMMGPAVTVTNKRGLLLRIWYYLRPYRWRMALVALLVVLTSLLGLAGPFLMGRAIDRYIASGDLPGLARITALLALIYITTIAATWLQMVLMVRISQLSIRDLRNDLFAALQRLPLRYYDSRQHGELMSRVTNDADTISGAMSESVPQLINSGISVVGAGVMMFALSWQMAIAALITFPLVTLSLRWIGIRTRQGFRDRQKRLGTLNGLVEETISGQKVVLICRQQPHVTSQFTVANHNLRQAAVAATIYVGLMGPVMGVFRNLGFAILAGAGGYLVVIGLTTIGTVAAFMNYADHFNRPLVQLANLYASVQMALAGAERVFAVIDEAPEPPDKEDAWPLETTEGAVSFDHVTFGYERDKPVLTDVSFDVEPHQTVALVGPTGAGKTTIINLLTRFYDVDAGRILIDGWDIRDIQRDSLRRALGIVLQDTFLFTGTVRENIRYGRLDATDAEVEDAARRANADGFIRCLPHGYETMLSEAGSSLSEGQRQLLAIARTLLADPAILVLDEATSSVDTRTEVHLQQAMRQLMHGRTCFVIAHRLNTIREADVIFVVEGGQIVERGTHSELLVQRGPYYRLYQASFGVPA